MGEERVMREIFLFSEGHRSKALKHWSAEGERDGECSRVEGK